MNLCIKQVERRYLQNNRLFFNLKIIDSFKMKIFNFRSNHLKFVWHTIFFTYFPLVKKRLLNYCPKIWYCVYLPIISREGQFIPKLFRVNVYLHNQFFTQQNFSINLTMNLNWIQIQKFFKSSEPVGSKPYKTSFISSMKNTIETIFIIER